MSQALYDGPKIDGHYWYYEDDEWKVVELIKKQVYFIGRGAPTPVRDCRGEFYGPIPRPA